MHFIRILLLISSREKTMAAKKEKKWRQASNFSLQKHSSIKHAGPDNKGNDPTSTNREKK